MTIPAPAPRSPAPPFELDYGFVVATGIECSAPLVAGGIRQDELVKTGHWDAVEDDVALVASYGIRYLRYGIPFHVVARDPRSFDWAWTDRAMGAVRDAGIEPIADLVHFGVPDHLDGFGDPRLPDVVRRYAAAFADRYPWVRLYTPVNEPLVGATFSARTGWWNERGTDDRTFVAAIVESAAAIVAASEEIRIRRPDAMFVQSDGCDAYTPASVSAVTLADFLNARRFLPYQLVYGRRPDERVVAWLAQNGVGEDRLAWFAEHGSSEGCIVGHDYYAGNEWLVEESGRLRPVPERRGYAAIAREYHAGLDVPFFLSETNFDGDRAPDWLAETWNEALQLRLEGLPIRGFCWYGFVDHVDWDSCLRFDAGRQNQCGLVGLDRQPHPVGDQYRALAEAARDGIFRPLPVESVEAIHHSVIPTFDEVLGNGPTVVSSDAVA